MFKSIRSKLAFIVSLIVVISLSLLSFLIYRTASQAVERRVEKETQGVSNQVSQQILKSIEADIHILRILSEMIQTATNIDDALAKQHKVLTEFGHIFVVGTDGLLTNLSPFDHTLRGIDLSKTDYVSYVKKEQKAFVSEPQRSFFDYEAIVIAVPIFFDLGSEKLEFLGIMCGTLKLNTLFKPVMNLHLEQSGYAMVVNQNGFILSHPNPSVARQKRITEQELDNPSLVTLWEAIMEKKKGVLQYIYQGQTQIAGYTPVGINNWSVLVTLPLKEVLTDIEKLKTSALVLTLVFLGFTILAIFFVARSLSGPIVSMTREVQIFIGKTIQNMGTQKGNEISILAVSLKALMNYLQEMAGMASHISQGDLSLQIQPRSKLDVLGHAFVQMTHYFKEIAETANKLARGDLTQIVNPKSEKDILGLAFKNMILQLRILVSQIRRNAYQIGQVSTQILARSDEDLKTVEDITSSTEETSSAMSQMVASIEEVAENTRVLFSSTEEISSSIEQMFTSIQQVTHNSEKLSELAEITATAMNQMAFSVEMVAKNAEDSQHFYQETSEIALQGQTSVQQVVTNMNKIRQVVSSATQTIQNLEDKSQEIGSILEVIDTISEQTTLLALNASIIAAQAGEHGRGFAVVADEIKELANRVATSTQEITQIIKDVQRQSANAVEVVHEGNKEVDEGVKLVNLAGQALDHITLSARKSLSAATDIARAIQEQKESTQKVMESMRKMTEQISEINQATQEQEKGSSQILRAVEEVKGLTEQVKRATLEQTRGAGQVSLAMDEVKKLIAQSIGNARQSAQTAKELSSQAKGLHELMERFILNEN